MAETVKGEPVREQDITAWADEAERGQDVAVLHERGRGPAGGGPGRVVPVRSDDTLLGALGDRAERDRVRCGSDPRDHPPPCGVIVHASAAEHGVAAEDPVLAAEPPRAGRPAVRQWQRAGPPPREARRPYLDLLD